MQTRNKEMDTAKQKRMMNSVDEREENETSHNHSPKRLRPIEWAPPKKLSGAIGKGIRKKHSEGQRPHTHT